MLFTIEVTPIPPEQIVNATHSAGEKAIQFGQGLSEPLVVMSIIVAGIVLLAGLVLAALGVTKKILVAGFCILLGAAIMYMFTNQPLEIVGIIKGFILSIFGSIKGGGAS
ncbi:hypothetical protein IT084_05345 [Desulfallas sp. Bu1-1]|jgi:hypothetical protein|uniref:hypothetical protein n=1 Tax=Desulfallas sp. Bu1-1 TaxID=2787620 RepID=UPI00189D4A8A|nr:hypothetical protein [Desulfallas sp. Bu1-1]MBF7082403.1 hypothetical protein [Desulfallas sp. Bu1-1]